MFYWVLVQYVSVPLSIWTLFLGRPLWSDPKEQRRCGMNLHNRCCALRFTAKRNCQCAHHAWMRRGNTPLWNWRGTSTCTSYTGSASVTQTRASQTFKIPAIYTYFPKIYIFFLTVTRLHGYARVKHKRLFSIYFQYHWSDDKQPMNIQVDCDETSSLAV